MRLIDADELKEYFPKDEDWDYPVNTNSEVVEIIDDAPTVDAVEVVRCKDCRNCEERQTANYLPFLYCKTHEHSVLSDFYCSWGERREDVRITDNN